MLSSWYVTVLLDDLSHFMPPYQKFSSLVDKSLADVGLSGRDTFITSGFLSDDSQVNLRHKILQLALTFMCAIAQLSPGAYFLQKDLYPSLVSVCCPISSCTPSDPFELVHQVSGYSTLHF